MSQTKQNVGVADIIIGQPKKESDAASAASCPITFTQFSGTPNSRLTKAFSLGGDGEIVKDSAPIFFDGNAKSININNLSEIESIIESLQTNQCIATGVFDETTCKIVTVSSYQNLDDKSGFRTRTKEHMQQPEVGLALLDYDPNPFMPDQLRCDTPEALMAKVTTACSELRDVGYSSTGSASSGIYKKGTNEAYTGGGGMHVYIAVKNVDLEQFRRFIEVRLWLAGFGYIAFARNGAMLVRTLIDISVLSPERLIYEARPVLGEGIGQKGRVWTHQPGAVIKKIPALTDEEVARYEELVADAKKHPDTVAEAEILLESHHAGRVRKLADTKKITVAEAEKQLPRRTLADLEKSTQYLDLNDAIEIGGETVLVTELLERGEEFDGKAMPDPIEGSAYGKTTAKFYFNDGNSPCIRSFAHGLQTIYKMNQQALVSKIPGRPNNRALAFNRAGLTKPLDPEGFLHTRPLKNDSVKPICTIQNVELMLYGYYIIVRYNVILKECEILIPGQTSVSENSANTAIEIINSLAAMNHMPIGQVPKYVEAIADLNPYNPVMNWITSEPWDGRDRLPDICNTLTTQEDYPADFKVTLMTNWFKGATAAATLASGFHGRGILTLQGPQGCGKTSWVRSLIPDGILRDNVILTGHHLDPSNKDSLTTAIKHWIVEIGELDSSFKKDIARLKGFVTQDKDKVRRPYSRTNSEYQRRTVFIATVNEVNFLIDKTGNTRFWPIPVTGVNYNHGIDMQQLFAQLKQELDAGATWWLTPEEDVRLEELNRDHRAVSALEEKLLEAFDSTLPKDRWSNMSATQVLEYIGYQRPSNPLCRECGGILREHFGQPKKSQGVAKWKVPIDRKRTGSL